MLELAYRLSPIFALSIASFLVLLVESFSKKKNQVSFYVSLLGIIVAGFFCFKIFSLSSITVFQSSLILDRFWTLLTAILIATALFIVLLSKKSEVLKGEYYFLVLMGVVGMSFVVSSLHLLMVFLGIELLSLCFYVMVTCPKDNLRANEGALKYFILGAFAAGFLVFGIALIYATCGSFLIPDIAKYLTEHQELNPTFLIGVAFLILALGFKIAAVPFHMWTPDAYEGAPTAVTCFMATGVKVAAFAALFRVFLVALLPIKSQWVPVFYILTVLTMTVGNFAAIIQENIKRLLAYSAIAHAGYLLIAFVSFKSPQNTAPIQSFIYYIIVYCVMNIGAFATVIAVGRDNLSDYRGLGFKYPYLAFTLSIFLLALAGFPPTGGFLAKFYIFSAAIQSQYYWLTVIAVLNAFVGIYYYTKVIVLMYMTESTSTLALKPSKILSLTLTLTWIATLYLGIHPTFINSLIEQSIQGLF